MEDVLQAMKVSWRQSIFSLRTKLYKSSIFEGLKKLKHRWAKCIDVKGDYIEKEDH
jgi:hypothetical protein